MSGDWRRPKVTTPSEDQHIKVAEVVWASDPDASWLTAFRGFFRLPPAGGSPGADPELTAENKIWNTSGRARKLCEERAVGNTLLSLLLLQLDHRQLAEDGWMMHKYICRRHN